MGTQFTAGQEPTADDLNQYYGHADTTSTAVTATSSTRLTTSYSIPADEVTAGESAYEILFGGSGTWASSGPQALSFELNLQSTTICANITIAAGAFSTSASFRFWGRAELVCDSAGATGGYFGGFTVTLTQTANNVLPGTAADNTVSIADAASSAVTIDTTSSAAAIMKCHWASATGSPTITNRRTVFRKIS